MPLLQYFGLHYHTLVHIYVSVHCPTHCTLSFFPLLPPPPSCTHYSPPPSPPLPSPPYPGVTTWKCDKLQRLDLSHNHIRALPDCFQSLKKLKQLRVSYNILTELPLSLCWGSIGLVSQPYTRTRAESSSFGARVMLSLHVRSNNFSASKTFRPQWSSSITALFCN